MTICSSWNSLQNAFLYYLIKFKLTKLSPINHQEFSVKNSEHVYIRIIRLFGAFMCVYRKTSIYHLSGEHEPLMLLTNWNTQLHNLFEGSMFCTLFEYRTISEKNWELLFSKKKRYKSFLRPNNRKYCCEIVITCPYYRCSSLSHKGSVLSNADMAW